MFYIAGMVTHRIRTITDLVRQGYSLKVVCQCGHTAHLDPMTLIVRLEALEGRLRCGHCGSREVDYCAGIGDE